MSTTRVDSIGIAVSVAAAVALSGCGGNQKDRADMAEAELEALQEAFGADELTPDAIAALHARVAELMDRADISPDEVRALEEALAQALEPSWTPLVSGVERDYSASTSQHTDAAVTMIESDRRGTFYVTYMFDGVEQRIHFTADEYSPSIQEFYNPGNPDYYFWDASGSFTVVPEFKYFNVNGWSVAQYEVAPDGSNGDILRNWRGHVVYGTPTATLPVAGTAEYEGRMYANSFLRTDPRSGTGRYRHEGRLNLNADFDNSTVDGMVDSIWELEPGQDWVLTTAEIQIRNGTIANSEFSADLEGLHDLAGLTGTATGQFFGPEAEEVGGVISAEDADAVYEGYFGGKKQ